jgi:MYXO-CTERM domain-containing protein
MPDGWEVENDLDPLADDSGSDPDADALANLAEMDAGTDPLDADTDGDGMPDGWEVANGLDPLADDSQADPDGDGKVNLDEYLDGTDPNVSLEALVDELIEQIGIGCLPGVGPSAGWAMLPLVALCLPWAVRRRKR